MEVEGLLRGIIAVGVLKHAEVKKRLRFLIIRGMSRAH
jgi:hypothetical protein